MYVYEEIDEDEYDEYESRKKRGGRTGGSGKHENDQSAASKKPTKRNYTKDKVSTASETSSASPAAAAEGTDIRTAFLRSSMISNTKHSSKTGSEAFSCDKIDQDELANEIMQELSRKNKPSHHRTQNKPTPTNQNIRLKLLASILLFNSFI